MKGEFIPRKFRIVNLLFLVGGLCSIGFYIYLVVAVPEDAGLLFFPILGVVLCSLSVLTYLITKNGTVAVDETTIKARYGTFWKIDCALTDVAFAGAQGNALTVRLKNGKVHTIMNLTNARQLASYIRKRLAPEDKEPPDALIEKRSLLMKTRKKDIFRICVGFAFMLLMIFLTVFLTDGKELNEFGNTDRIIFALMIVTELITVVLIFRLAGRAGNSFDLIGHLQYTIRKRVVETAELPPGNVIRVLTDEDCDGRLTVYGYPNDDRVYYVVQHFDKDFSLVTTFESDIFENAGQLPDGFDSLTDVTEKFISNHDVTA